MKILITFFTFIAYSQTQYPVYECQSESVEEHRITIIKNLLSDSKKPFYTANFFDNDTELELDCETNKNKVVFSCFGSDLNREVLVDFKYINRSYILGGTLIEKWNNSTNDYADTYSCKTLD